jgi:hypothetical protein
MQDATGTMACLQFEALGTPKPKVEFAILYVDHNILQVGFKTQMTIDFFKHSVRNMESISQTRKRNLPSPSFQKKESFPDWESISPI